MTRVAGEILVGIDVGADGHQVAIQAPDGSLIDELYIVHQHDNFDVLIKRLQALVDTHRARVVVGIEGCNGYIAPFDQMLVAAGFEVLNINPTRLYHFRRLYGAPYKNDSHDARLITGYLKARGLLNLGDPERRSLLPIKTGSDIHKRLRLLSRYLDELIREQTRVRNRLTKRLKEYCPELVALAKQVNRKWLLILLAHCSSIQSLQVMTVEEIKKLQGDTGYRIGPKKAVQIKHVVDAVDYCSPLNEEYALILKNYALELLRYAALITTTQVQIEQLGRDSVYYQLLLTQPGIGVKLAGKMIGEILSINNFHSKDAFAAYNGTCCLDHKSGKRQESTTRNLLCNRRLQTAMRNWAGCRIRCHRSSRAYYEKKRNEGKRHNHALKCLSRQLSNLLYRRLKQIESQAYELQLISEAA
jgi:transposase